MTEPTRVYLHPVGLDGGTWTFLDTGVLDGAVTYTMLWHGGRPEPSEPLSMQTMAADVLDHVPGTLDLVGFSMGGAVALAAAIAAPDRVRSILVGCASAGGGDGAVQHQRALAAEELGMSGVVDDHLGRWFTPAALEPPAHPGVTCARDRLLGASAESFAAAWRALAANDAIHRLSSIRAGTTILHAAGDVSTDLESKRKTASMIRGARLRVIDGPHMAQLENPSEVSQAISEHLEWVRG